MAISPMSDNLNIISALADKPNATDGLSATQLKAKFDQGPGLIKTYLNSTVVTSFNTHIAEVISYRASATRDLSLTGTQKITIPFSAKAVFITAAVEGTINFSDGKYAVNYGDSCVTRRGDNIYVIRDNLINIDNGAGNSSVADLTLVESDGITLTWTKTGSPTGTLTMSILAMTHY
jgi:hypothetical protein